jgi:hypothetical protein
LRWPNNFPGSPDHCDFHTFDLSIIRRDFCTCRFPRCLLLAVGGSARRGIFCACGDPCAAAIEETPSPLFRNHGPFSFSPPRPRHHRRRRAFCLLGVIAFLRVVVFVASFQRIHASAEGGSGFAISPFRSLPTPPAVMRWPRPRPGRTRLRCASANGLMLRSMAKPFAIIAAASLGAIRNIVRCIRRPTSTRFNDEAVFSGVEERIYTDACAAADSPDSIPAGDTADAYQDARLSSSGERVFWFP